MKDVTPCFSIIKNKEYLNTRMDQIFNWKNHPFMVFVDCNKLYQFIMLKVYVS